MAGAYVTDVGNNQMWSAQSCRLKPNQRFLTSGGMGSMGFALPAAIGASFSGQKMPVIMLCGDGGMQCNIQELETVRRGNLPIKMIVFNNNSLGMIRGQQKELMEGRYAASTEGYSSPDFEKISKSYAISSMTISKQDEVEKGLAKLWEYPGETFSIASNAAE